MKLSIIIVHYNVKELLAQCLQSVERACKDLEAEIFVVDNASTDGSEAYFRNSFSNVHFYWNQTNVGFAKANNSVLSQASGDYILFLNPDTLIPEDSLIKCIDFFEKHKQCGALGVYMKDGNGHYLKESKRGFPSPLTSFFKLIGLCKVFPHSKIFAKYYEGHLSPNQNHIVEVLSGAFMMVSHEVIEKSGGFDESFFMYGEDIDLSYRIRLLGYDNFYFSGTHIIHYKNKSASQNKLAARKHFYEAMKTFVRKHYTDNIIKKRFLLAGIDILQSLALIKIKILS